MPEGAHYGNHIILQQVQSKLNGLSRKREREKKKKSQVIKTAVYQLLEIRFLNLKLNCLPNGDTAPSP